MVKTTVGGVAKEGSFIIIVDRVAFGHVFGAVQRPLDDLQAALIATDGSIIILLPGTGNPREEAAAPETKAWMV